VFAAVLPKLKFGRPVVRLGGRLAFREARRNFPTSTRGRNGFDFECEARPACRGWFVGLV